MVDELTKRLITEVVLDADAAIKKAQALQDRISALKKELSQLNQLKIDLGGSVGPQLEEEIQGVSESIGAAQAETERLNKAFFDVEDSSEKAAVGVEKTAAATGAATKEFSVLGNVVNRVFRSIVGFIVLNILRRLLGVYGELVDAGKDLARSIIDVSLAVRQLQRSGEQITQLEVAKFIQDLRKEFGLFSTQELNAGIGALLILGEQLNFTKEQLFGVAEATAVAAARTGTDYKTAIDRVTRALATGQTRGLTELGFAISETAIEEEALRLGLVETADQLDRNTKAQAIYSIVLRQSAELQEDVAALQESLVGSIQKQEASVESLKESIGSKLLPIQRGWLELQARLYAGINGLIGIIIVLSGEIGSRLGAAYTVAGEAAASFWSAISGEGQILSFDDIVTRYKNIRDELLQISQEATQNLFDPSLGDLNIGVKDIADDVSSNADEIIDAYDDLYVKLRESVIDGNNAIEKENRTFLDKLAEMAARFALKVKQLADKLAFDRAKIWRDYNNKVSDINDDARKKEIDAEEKFQEKLRQLRERFLLDLEDALQERDARQILRLIRTFNQRKNELERQRDVEKQDIEEDRKRELEDIQKRRDERLKELDIEYAYRQQKITDEYNLERQLAETDHQNRLRELRIRTNERNAEIIRRFADEYDITSEWARSITARLNEEFGPGGAIDTIYAYMLQSAAYAFAQLSQIRASAYGTLTTSVGTGTIGGVNDSNPIDVGSPPSDTGLPPSPTEGGGPIYQKGLDSQQANKTVVEILLSKGLEGKIIDQTKNQLADVFLSVARK